MKKNVQGIVVVFMSTLVVVATLGFNCDETKASMFPCVGYLTGGGDPSIACCSAVSDLKASTPNRDDRISACKCLKEAATHIPNINDQFAAALPKRCGVDIGFPISKNINCNG